MFKNVTKWLGVVDNTVEDKTLAVNSEGEEKPVENVDKTQDSSGSDSKEKDVTEQENDDLISPETKQTLEDVSAKAISTAKEWGS